jgi:trafficking protein particle complex subunit 8
MNVNDCLSLEGICNIANEETEEVGADLTVKNLNQNHHLYKVDASISDLYVYCEKFALNSGKIYCKFLSYEILYLFSEFSKLSYQINSHK